MAVNPTQIKDILSEASTLSSVKINTQKVSKNILNQYASYNYLFTLSGISTVELQNCTFFNGPPHDIIARSAGIGDQDNSIIDDEGGLGAETASTLSKRGIESLIRDRTILNQNRDLYFQSVDIDSFHAMNPERGTSPVTKIRMKLIEPTGVSLFNKLRAAAANNGFRDHINAPFLFTITFAGQDELGKTIDKNKDSLTRHIPIRIYKCNLSVNQAGTEYDIEAVPHNEFGYMDRFLYTRTNISLSKKSTLFSYMQNLQNALNSQTEDEAKQRFFEEGKQDEYKIVLHPAIASQELTPLYDGYKNLKEIEMATQREEASEGSVSLGTVGYETKGGQIQRGTSILKILEQATRSTERYKNLIENWFTKTTKNLSTSKSGQKLFSTQDLARYLDDDPGKYFVDWFRVKSTVEILPEFDNITKQQKKRITFYVYPYKIHVYRLAVPGASLGGAGAFNARKVYDYLFTGNNTEVLNWDIEYKYAYYQTALKDMDPNFMSSSTINYQTNQPGTVGGGATPDSVEPLLPYQQNVGLATGASTGATIQTFKLVDVFMDQLTNPQADMVNIRLDIMGDPAWLPQTQFLPVRALGDIAVDENLKNLTYADGKDVGWNTRFGNFNTDISDPVILINFKMPVDFNDRLGIYNFNEESSGMFSGLYQVYKTTHSFEQGQFRQTLHCFRFNNQSQISQKGTQKLEFAIGADGDIITSVPKKVNITAAGNDANPNTAGDTF